MTGGRFNSASGLLTKACLRMNNWGSTFGGRASIIGGGAIGAYQQYAGPGGYKEQRQTHGVLGSMFYSSFNLRNWASRSVMGYGAIGAGYGLQRGIGAVKASRGAFVGPRRPIGYGTSLGKRIYGKGWSAK